MTSPRTFTRTYDETGGYDCMTPAYVIKDAEGRTVAEVDLRHFKAPPASGWDAARVRIEGEKRAEAVSALLTLAPELLALVQESAEVIPTTPRHAKLVKDCRALLARLPAA